MVAVMMVKKNLSLGVAVLLCFTPVLNAQCDLGGNVIPPSYGDVIRLKSGLVMIYLEPDGAPYNINAWGTISASESYNVGFTLCRQLGFVGGDSVYYSKDPPECLKNFPVFLTNIKCEDHENHILNCNYDFYPDRSNKDHRHDAYLNCGNEVKNSYSDQVVLLPPDGIYVNQSHSFGMVGIRQDEGSGSFVYIRKNGPGVISPELADTLCRSMGYTHAMPNSAMSVQEYRYVSNYTYDNQDHVTNSIDSTELQCSRTFPCIRCCFSSSHQELRSYQEDFRYEDALVLRCLYYNSTSTITLGNEVLCESQGDSSVCSSSGGSVDCTRNAGVEAAAIALAILLAISLLPWSLRLIAYLQSVYKTKGYKKINVESVNGQ